ncbi:helix-turn-helix domain-containing protein [Streptomyces sp. DG1A-41]|uniref:winged helix-turn-helix transcriptional regulator n=1 Tax=Streptomyces sp. DG1A-41 TaxID=3125779 RepID=UPI0030D04B10
MEVSDTTYVDRVRMAEGDGVCPQRVTMEHVTSRWGTLALIALLDRSYRFSELRREIGRVSEKMLTQTLQTLERDGLVHRDAKPVIPPRVDYSLTELGREAAEQIRGLALWTEQRLAAIQKARQEYDAAKRDPSERAGRSTDARPRSVRA